MKLFAPALAAFLLASPGLAAAPQSDSQAAQNETETAGQVADNSQNRIICKREKVSGSRLKSRKTCLTAAQWDQLKRDQRQATERIQNGRTKSD